jgi:hypothetical protein
MNLKPTLINTLMITTLVVVLGVLGFRFLSDYHSQSPIQINEISMGNTDFKTWDGETKPWVELCNFSDSVENLASYQLSYDDETFHFSLLRSLEEQLSINSGECQVFFLDTEETAWWSEYDEFWLDLDISKSQPSTFRLSNNARLGERVDLSNLFYSENFSEKPSQISFSKDSDKYWKTTSTPTPFLPDNNFTEWNNDQITSNPKSGIYHQDSLTVSFQSEEDHTLYYTTDASDPRTSGKVLNNPEIELAPEFGPHNSNVDRHIDFYEGTPKPQDNASTLPLANVLRFASQDSNGNWSEVFDYSFILDPQNQLKDRVIFQVISDPDNFFSQEKGIFSSFDDDLIAQNQDGISLNIAKEFSQYFSSSKLNEDLFRNSHPSMIRGGQLELDSQILILNDQQQVQQFDGTVRANGGASNIFLQRSFRFYPTDSQLNTTDKHNLPSATWLFRANGTDNITGVETEDASKITMIKNEVAYDMARQLGDLYLETEYVEIYLNQEYWGIYSLQDRPDQDYFSKFWNTDKNDLTISGFYLSGLRYGSYEKIQEFLGSISDFQQTQKLPKNWDIDSLSSYILLNMLMYNSDFPDRDDRRIFDGEKWHWFSYDFDSQHQDLSDFKGVALIPEVTVETISPVMKTELMIQCLEKAEMCESNKHTLLLDSIYTQILSNPTYRENFRQYTRDTLNNTITEDFIKQVIVQRQSEIQPGFTDHRLRWNQGFTADELKQNQSDFQQLLLDNRNRILEAVE